MTQPGGDGDGRLAAAAARAVYLALSYVLVPLLLAVVLWRVLTRPPYRSRWYERFGFAPRSRASATIWVHAVSVGEAQAAVPLVRALQQRYPHDRVLITTTTPTGAAQVARRYGGAVTHAYVPYDLRGAIARFLDRVQPTLLLIIETELWPHMLQACRRRAIPVVFANARLTSRSLSRYLRWRALFRDALQNVVVAAQSESDAARFRQLAPSSAQVYASGNLKFDVEIDSTVVARGRAWRRRQVAESRIVLVAGSTHDGEEQALLDACERLWEAGLDLLLVLVPRHPERFEAVAQMMPGRSVSLLRRSQAGLDTPLRDTQVLLVDAMGELPMFYAAADLAFVGGSLVPVGGHNLLEPAALGLPTLTGPVHHNAPEVAERLAEAGALRIVEGVSAIAQSVLELTGDAGAARHMGEAGRRTVAANRGAVAAVMRLVEGAHGDSTIASVRD